MKCSRLSLLPLLLALIFASPAVALQVGDPAPAFSLRDSHGKNFHLRDQVGERYGVRFLPTTFLISCDGEVREIIVGVLPNPEEALRKKAAQLLR